MSRSSPRRASGKRTGGVGEEAAREADWDNLNIWLHGSVIVTLPELPPMIETQEKQTRMHSVRNDIKTWIEFSLTRADADDADDTDAREAD